MFCILTENYLNNIFSGFFSYLVNMMSKTVSQNSNFCNNFVTDIYRHHKDTICCHQSKQVDENEDACHVYLQVRCVPDRNIPWHSFHTWDSSCWGQAWDIHPVNQRHDCDRSTSQYYQKNRLGQPGLQTYTVPIKADVQKRHWYNKRAQQKTINTESKLLQTPLLLDQSG